MQPRFEQEILIPPSACDYSGKLGYAMCADIIAKTVEMSE